MISSPVRSPAPPQALSQDPGQPSHLQAFRNWEAEGDSDSRPRWVVSWPRLRNAVSEQEGPTFHQLLWNREGRQGCRDNRATRWCSGSFLLSYILSGSRGLRGPGITNYGSWKGPEQASPPLSPAWAQEPASKPSHPPSQQGSSTSVSCNEVLGERV